MTERKPDGKFLPGHGVTGGRVAGSRNRLTGAFLEALAQDFEQGGAAAIKIVRIEEPATYLRVIASLLPKEFAISDAKLSELGDEEIASLLATVRELKAQTEQIRDDNESVH
jgi:hypothetical protein